MPDESKEKTLEMRVAELEDKLSKMHVTEEEMKAFQKVSALMGGGGGGGAAGLTAGGVSPQAGCILDCVGGCINECAIRACTIRACTIRACTIRACTIRACTFECGGNCDPGGGGLIGGGGFGGFGG